MSPILVRPVREQLEHDRIIRLLQAKCRRRYEVGMNPGAEKNTAVGIGTTAIYPDLVLFAQDRGRRLQGVVEVETVESVNHLEALAQWAHLGRLHTAFHLYVPATMVDVARRLCEGNQVYVTEIWTYHMVGDQPRFTIVYKNKDVPEPPPAPRAAVTSKSAAPAAKTAAPAKPGANGKAAPSGKAATNGKRKTAAKTAKTARQRPSARSVKKPSRPQKSAKSQKRR